MKTKIAWYFDRVMTMIKGPDFRIFIIFLLISVFIWVIEKLRQNYTVEVEYRVECLDVPEEYVVETEGVEGIHAVVSGEGLELLSLPSKRKRKVQVSILQLRKMMQDGKTVAVVIPRRFAHDVAQTLPDHISLERVEADTIYIPLLTKKRKMLPVVVRDNATLETQHMFSGPRKINPDTVWVSGTNDKIDTMTAVYTEVMPPIVLHDSISLRVDFDLPKGIEASSMGTQVSYHVEPYTEKVISVPITAVNIPSGYVFKAFPQMVTVTIQLGLSKYDEITANDIDIIADLHDVKPGSRDKRIKVKLTDYPGYVKNISYSPLFTEFLLERQHIKLSYPQQ